MPRCPISGRYRACRPRWRPQCHCGGYPPSGGGRVLSAFPSRHDGSLDLGEGPQREAEKSRRGLAQERKLSDVAFDMPFCMRAVLEEDNVAGAVARRSHRIVFKNERALKDHASLV